MHYLIGLAVLVGLVTYGFGEQIARAFVAAFLVVCAVGLLFIVSVAVLDMHRQSVVQKQRDIHMLPNNWKNYADSPEEYEACASSGGNWKHGC